MIHIGDILMCPTCRAGLALDLSCPVCHTRYSKIGGVYDIVSKAVSGDHEFWSEEQVEWMKNRSFEDMDRDDQLYYACYGDELSEACRKQEEYVSGFLSQLTGDVCDVASGGGAMLCLFLKINRSASSLVCTDIEKHVMIKARGRWKTDDRRVFYVASDARQMSIKDESFDALIANTAFGNVTKPEQCAKELFRILKPGGLLISKGMYIDKDSESRRLARTLGVERGVVEETLLEDLKSAGFEILESTVVASPVWPQNDYDAFPAAGDRNHFCVVRARRPG